MVNQDRQVCTDQLFISADFRYRGYPAYTHKVSLRSPRQPHHLNHGTGCSFSSALAAALALGYALEDAFVVAKTYINQGLSQPVAVTENHGTLGHWGFPRNPNYLPELLTEHLQPQAKAFAPLKAALGLYVIVPSVTELKRALAAGVKTLQLRIKNTDQQLLRQQIKEAIQLCHQPDIQLFINDHWQLALELGAYGVHLGQEDINSANLAALQQAGLRLGVSSHGFYKLLRAQQLKPQLSGDRRQFLPLKPKRWAANYKGYRSSLVMSASIPTTPLVAIGGINENNAKAVLATGIRHLAVVQAFANGNSSQTLGATDAAADRAGPTGEKAMLTDLEFIRYSRQLMLPDFGEAAQLKLKQSKVLLIGCGGLGNAASQYLVSSGIGQLTLVDGDKVELSNLQRQVLFRNSDKGFNKAKIAARQLKQLNPHVQIKPVEQHFSADNAEALLANTDWVLDCTDNFQSRKLINQLCQQHQISLVSAAAIAQQGQLMLWPFALNQSACYCCLFPDLNDHSGNCSSLGVLAPLLGIIGSMQAMLLIQQIIQPDHQAKFWQFEGMGFRLMSYEIAA